MSLLVVCAAAVATLNVAENARADEPDEPEEKHRIEWDESNRRVSPGEYLAGGLSLAGALTIEFFVPQPKQAVWTGSNEFDAPFRIMAGATREQRDQAALASTVIELFVAAYPIVVDATIVVLAADKNPDVFNQMMAMNGLSYGMTYLATRSLHRLMPRARPEYIGCRDDGKYTEHCGKGDTASWPSGHVSISAAGAGVTCAHHAYLPLYGGGPPDALACAGATGLALTVGMLRFVADRHWASDVLLGFGIGYSLGLGLPILLHYEAKDPFEDGEDEPRTVQQAITPMPQPAVFNWGMAF